MGESTKRVVNEGAEKWLYEEVKVLDKGYIKLIDYLGTDLSVVAAARVSYAKGVDPTEVDRNNKLINYLMKNKHTSPFEQCVLTFECKMPIFVAREWVRHRTARLNEMSGRYTVLPDEFYMPDRDRIKGQDKVNKQGSAGEINDIKKDLFLKLHSANGNVLFNDYHLYIDQLGIAKELARIDLPLSTYTKWVWQCDLHNLLHFLKLRMAAGAQWEIRQFANAIAQVVKDSYPVVWAAFEEHTLNSMTLSASEVDKLRQFIVAAIPCIQAVSKHGPGEDVMEVIKKIVS